MTRMVQVGGVAIGGGAPVSVQSMTNTDTRDVQATVEQIQRLTDAGCEIVRASVYDQACAAAIREIKEQIRIPLVADIHFDYRLAIAAMENGVDKLRFNPGNIGEAKNVRSLVACAKTHHVPIRIGVNAGSLEPALLQKYGGPTPQAMVESACKHIALLESEGFYDIVVSLKASSVRSTLDAYRAMAREAQYPLHIGVTEAGAGEAALIKSAMGIGALLLDGIGDTLRVSITGDPVREVETGIAILRAAGIRKTGVEIISCPTCGRCKVELDKIVAWLKERLPMNTQNYLKIAVMGCAVNGPGEAREADIGIAFGNGNGVLFEKGQQICAGPVNEILERLVAQALLML